MNSTQIWKKKVVSVAIFELVMQIKFNVPFEIYFVQKRNN